MKYIWIVLLALNLISLWMMYTDKRRARRSARRISHRALFGIAYLGGALGILCGMYWFHHKTRKAVFRWGIPGIMLLHGVILGFGIYLGWFFK